MLFSPSRMNIWRCLVHLSIGFLMPKRLKQVPIWFKTSIPTLLLLKNTAESFTERNFNKIEPHIHMPQIEWTCLLDDKQRKRSRDIFGILDMFPKSTWSSFMLLVIFVFKKAKINRSERDQEILNFVWDWNGYPNRVKYTFNLFRFSKYVLLGDTFLVFETLFENSLLF